MNGSVLVVSFSFEQVAEAFSALTDANVLPVVWRHNTALQLSDDELIAYWNTLPEKPRAIVMGADVAITETFLAHAPTLEIISLNCAGYDHVDLEACRKHGVRVCNVPRRNYDAVADFAWGQILGLMRNVAKGDRAIRAGNWCVGVERAAAVSKKTLGIIGMGAIGQAVARRAKGFDMRIIALSTTKKPDIAAEFNLTYQDGEAFFSEADIIVICCPHNEDTHHMICERTLHMMKRTAFLINPSRGGIVDTEALCNALTDGGIAGAALDVYEQEPLFESPLFGLDNVLLTPHIGGLADREIDDVAIRAAKNCVLLLDGQAVESRLV